MLQEVRQAGLPGPARIRSRFGPMVIVAGLAAHVDHAVDARAATQHLAAWIAQAAAVEPFTRVRLEAPVGARVADAIQIADGYVDPQVPVGAAGLDQQDLAGRVGAQPVGEQAARRSGAHDHIVENWGGCTRQRCLALTHACDGHQLLLGLTQSERTLKSRIAAFFSLRKTTPWESARAGGSAFLDNRAPETGCGAFLKWFTTG